MSKIKDLFWKKSDEEKSTVEKSTKPSKETKTPGSISSLDKTPGFGFLSPSSISSIAPEPNSSTGVRKQEIVDYFKKVMEENNFPGPDYCEFVNALDDMKNMAMDEATKVKTIFISFKSMGMTPQKLVETAEKYKILYAEKMKAFDKQVEASFNEEVVNKQKLVADLTAKNSAIDVEMKKLNDQKIANDEAAKKLNDEIANTSTLLKTKHGDFKESYNSIVAEIDNNIATINKHLM